LAKLEKRSSPQLRAWFQRSRPDESKDEFTFCHPLPVVFCHPPPPGTLTREQNTAYKGAAAPAPAAGTAPGAAAGDWPSYNKTLTSERFSDLSQINTQNVGKLKVLCTYDTRQFTSFETGLIMVEGALIGTTEFDIFSLDPATCAQNWRTHEDYPGYLLPTNRGAA
jgi:alcohol dehydrogenase (cytochrome c)